MVLVITKDVIVTIKQSVKKGSYKGKYIFWFLNICYSSSSHIFSKSIKMNPNDINPNQWERQKCKANFYEEDRKNRGHVYLIKNQSLYLDKEKKIYLYFQMPQSILRYDRHPDEDNNSWYRGRQYICWHCLPPSQDHIKDYAYPIQEDYTCTKLDFGYKLIRDKTLSAFETRLVLEIAWDKQYDDSPWCSKCRGSKLVAQSGWYPYHKWLNIYYGLFTCTNAFGMTHELTRKVPNFLK